ARPVGIAGRQQGQDAESRAGDVVPLARVGAVAAGGQIEVVCSPATILILVGDDPFESAFHRLFGLCRAAALAEENGAVFRIASLEAAGRQSEAPRLTLFGALLYPLGRALFFGTVCQARRGLFVPVSRAVADLRFAATAIESGVAPPLVRDLE